MIVPSRVQELRSSMLVQGAIVLRALHQGSSTIDSLRLQAVDQKSGDTLSMERLLDVLTFLHITGLVSVYGVYVRLNKSTEDTSAT